ncbi:MAG: polysaccharide biosynthesis/export family protein [Verrucomicrobia bacterium]|nr:polysaccharide biosynthesis/export family protein [Verrucomicrobiota bacterium]
MPALLPSHLRLWLTLLLGLASLDLAHAQTPAESVSTPASGTTTSPAYVLTNTDRIRVAVYQEEDLSLIARIDSQGRLNLPLVGEVAISGLKVVEAQQAIERAYKEGRFLRNPRVTISVEEYAAREVSIQGQIRSPGRYPLPIESSMTILELVTRSGGFTDTAKGTSVRVTRIHHDGTKKNFEVDVESLIKGKRGANVSDNSLVLEPGDIIFVPERLI